MSKPGVSVVIPCWNAEDHIGASIDSVLSQTYNNIEVIVIDDGSTDGSLDIIRSYGDRVRYESTGNRGACAARNRGLKLAQNDLIQFHDADDLLLPEKLSRQVVIATEKMPGSTVICDWETDSGEGHNFEERHLNYHDDDPFLFCLWSQLPTPSPLHWRCNLEKVGGFNEALPRCQEFDLNLRLACSGLGFIYLPEVLFQIQRQPNSISSDYVKVLEQKLVIHLNIYELLLTQGMLSDLRRQEIARAIAHDARHYVRHGEEGAASDYFSKASRIDSHGSRMAFGKWFTRAMAASIGPLRTEQILESLQKALGRR